MNFKNIFIATTLALGSFAASATILTNDLGGSAGFGENTLSANDDGSTSFIDLSSVFSDGLELGGTNYTGLYLNNNGNVTFDRRLNTFTPFALTGATENPIIAPFFADVDTRGSTVTSPGGNSTGSNLVYWDLDTSGTFTATWDDVGYFSSGALANSFQLALIDQGNGDFDIEFRYEEINWTTGDASDGSAGLGGTVARAGWNLGNGIDFSEISASGNQAEILNLTNTSNVGIDGLYRYDVRSGDIVASSIPEPTSIALFGLALAGFAARRKNN